ncbi:sirohydrochlorin cobaltochelatase [Pelagibaculum spongiae]|uniref:Cobalt chelatase n=1 Tax=Pelagibaculum spongiae TaxID=2080658 RepID=A0A2V1H742_9GAMM|nr:sirohydrochlorin cobaltochelatase [Pelagibaculum spongiae]PVZ72262.1 cobalt chelatase [Pelagibaculum spongiae]
MKRLRHYKKGTAIVLSCFGSVIEMARFIALKNEISLRYPNCHIELAVSSRMVIKKLAQQQTFHTLPQVLANLDAEGHQRILVVSCYLFPTDEHLQLNKMVDGFNQFSLANIQATPAILQKTGSASNILSALDQRFTAQPLNLYIQHGSPSLDNPGYQSQNYCDNLLRQLNPGNFCCSLEGAYPFELLADSLIQQMNSFCKHRKLPEAESKPTLRLIPMLLVSGNHFEKDLVSIKARLDDHFDVVIAEPVESKQTVNKQVVNKQIVNKKFCMLDLPELHAVIEKQIDEGLIRIKAESSELAVKE